jgi:hypothetical protein
MLEISSEVKADGAGRANEYITAKTCQVWNATDKRGFAWKCSSVEALQSNLRRMFLGYPLDQAIEGLVVQDIPVDSVDQYLKPATGFIEVIGIIDGNMSPDPKVACLGFKTLARDDFYRIVISAMDELTADDQL